MDLLALCNRLVVEAGMSSQTLATTANQTGQLARVVNWTQAAWEDIQNLRQDWKWMRKTLTFQTADGQAIYSLADLLAQDSTFLNFGTWERDSWRSYVTASGYVGEISLGHMMEYDAWRDSYFFGAQRNVRSRPVVIARDPGQGLCLGPVPASGYTVYGDYYECPTAMASDTASPGMPAKHHMIIAYRAMMHAGMFDAANEVYQRGEMEYRRMLQALTLDQAPLIGFGGPLA